MAETRRHRPPPQQPKRPRRDLRDRMTGGHGGGRDRGGGDSYRPGQQQNGSAPSRSDFTFTSNTQGPSFPPAQPPSDRAARRNRGRGRGGLSGMNGARPAPRSGDAAPSQYRGRRNNRGGFRPRAAHERALLQTRDDGTEHFLGVEAKSNKFRNLADLSDDEEADMDVGTDDTDKSDGEIDESQSKSKALRTQSNSRADGDSVPKWSNPDPYTVLPPPEETTGKRIDFVKLIRKAKNEIAEQNNGVNAVAANDDFISFGDDDDDASEPSVAPSRSAPRVQPLQGSLNDVVGAGSLGSASARDKRPAEPASLPARPPFSSLPARPTFTSSSTSSSRKRKQTDDQVGMKDAWRPKDRLDSAPWAFREDYKRLREQPERLLHNEIADFYDFVAPTDHDNEVRVDLIRRVQSVIGGEFQSHRGSIRCFGSFPIGLYLPTADMDLVFVSDSHYEGGPAKLVAGKNAMFNLAKKLRFNQVAFDTFVIPKARVPIIKFKDIATGLPVDISFENMSGVIAQSTLSKWKEQYGDHFTCLIALVKQLLEMYNLNDNSTGGLGGLSICCLVASFLKLNKLPENLGQAFLQFLDFFGNKFDYSRDRIVVDPPRIVRKGKLGIDGRPEREDRLSIQDPDDPQNNISGGSYKADKVLELFSWAHRVLVERMDTIHMSSVHDLSILDSVLGGDYSTYQQQRERMRSVRLQQNSEAAGADDDLSGTGAPPLVIDD